MLNDDKRRRDAFAFSLGGMRTITSFAAAPAIADNQLRQSRESEIVDAGADTMSDIPEDQPITSHVQPGPMGRFWLSRRSRAA
jgi:hypothetical protein